MKFLISQLMYFARNKPGRINFAGLLRFLVILVALVVTYSIIFHYIIEYEGQQESWITGFYWTLTVMSTLGFGDITFQSDLGRAFSIVVLMSGIIFLLVLLPFTFIEFFYAPWMKAQQEARTPTSLPDKTEDHVILVQFDPVTRTLIEKLEQYKYSYVLLVPEIDEALRLYDLGYQVMLGDLDDPETYRRAHVERAVMVAASASDQVNANVALTVREVTEQIPVVGTANAPASVDLLELAGCSNVLQLGEMMGQALARQVADGETMAHMIGQFDDLYIAEASVRGTPLVGKTLSEISLREDTGLNVIGIWERGTFRTARPDSCIKPTSVLVMGGARAGIDRYNELFRKPGGDVAPVIIIGGGRVGRAAAQALELRGLDYRIIDKEPTRIRDPEKFILGDGADLEVLERAGIREAPSVIVTTHDDDMNIYLTVYCRRLRPDMQVISRTTLERNIVTLHRAGADFVVSYASTGANAIINLIGRDNILMVAEGLDVFEVPVPETMVGKTIAECSIRQKTGCTVVGLHVGGEVQVMPDPYDPLPEHARIILIGEPEAEESFLKRFKTKDKH